jgi:hypothetical protein
VPPQAPRRRVEYQFGIVLCLGVPGFYLLTCVLVYLCSIWAAPDPHRVIVIPLATVVCCLLFAIGLAFMVLGRRLAGQQGTIAIRGRQLWVEVTGLWDQIQQHWPAEQIEVIQAAAADNWSVGGRPVMQLQIRPRHGPVVRLLAGREEPMLRRIAELLREQLRLPSREERQEAWLRRGIYAPLPPAGSDIACEDHPHGFTIRLPRMGYWRHASSDVRQLIFLTVGWWALLLTFTALLLLVPWRWNGPPASPWLFLLIPGIHWLIALALVLWLWTWAHRHGAINLHGERLEVVDVGRWRSRRGEWRCPDVYAISVECSAAAPAADGGGWTPAELRIHTWDGAGGGFFAGRNEEELGWLAAALRQALQLTAG